MSDPTPSPNTPATLINNYPPYAIISTTVGESAIGVTCDILLTEAGEPLVTQNNEYIATQGLVP